VRGPLTAALGSLHPIAVPIFDFDRSPRHPRNCSPRHGLFRAYAEALMAATPSHLLVGGQKPRKLKGVTADQMAKMEREMGNLEGQYKLAQQSHGEDVLNLVLAKGYLAKLLDNKAVSRFLSQRQSDVMAEFQNIVETVALDKG
jgi:hypothetical protein